MNPTLLFLLSLSAALFAATANRLLANWSGHFPLFLPLLLPAFLGGSLAGLLLNHLERRAFKPASWVGPRACALLALLLALLAGIAFSDIDALVKSWTFLSLNATIDYPTWRAFILRAGALWLLPTTALLPFLWLRTSQPRSRLILFVGACSGLILGHILIGRAPTLWLLNLTRLLLLLTAPLALLFACHTRRARIAAALFTCLLAAWAIQNTTFRFPRNLLTEVNPFATIAARDCFYTGQGTDNVLLLDGRLLRTHTLDRAPRAAAQLIPALLKPAATRIAFRSPAQDPLLPTYDTGKLKGLYDAIWVELPPAWLPDERDYFGSNALTSACKHLLPDGLLIYALDAHALDATMLLERIALLHRHLPHIQLWCTSQNHWQLVASRTPIRLDFDALSTLSDRPDITRALLQANLESPLNLLSSCLVADAFSLQDRLNTPIPAKLPRREPAHARALLFNRLTAQTLCKTFADQTDPDLPWLSLPAPLAQDLGDVLKTLRHARICALRGDYLKAAPIAPNDPFLLALADRECATARDWERLAEHEKALASYISAFQLAQPSLPDLLDAAKIAQTSPTPQRADPFYALAETLSPNDPRYLTQYAHYLYNNNRFPEAETIAKRALALLPDSADHPPVQFFIAQAIARQPGRATQGLQIARAIAAAATTPQDKERYILSYANLLILTDHPVLGVKTKRHFHTYGELLPENAP